MTTREGVLVALDRVIDPELDEPITRLRFVSAVEVGPDGDVSVRLRLPTPQCAPNFAFLMAADAHRAVRELPGVREVSVVLEDHYTGDEINRALSRREGFSGAFPGETDDDELGSLRELFTRKALLARQAKLCQTMLTQGASHEQVVQLCVRDLPDLPQARRCVELRAQLGIAADMDAPAFVRPDGQPLQAAELDRWLRMGRLVATSLDANGGLCRSMLEFRYDLEKEGVER